MRYRDCSSDVCFADLIIVQEDREGDERTRQALLGVTVRNASQHKRYVGADDCLIPVQVDVSLARDALGAPQYFITQVQDDRERHRHDNELSNEKEPAQVTLAAIGDAVLRTDGDGRIGFCNSAALRLLGHEPASEIEDRKSTRLNSSH